MHNFSGKLENFKSLLDNFLDKVPDEPITDSLIPSPKNVDGKSSNSIYDWCRKGDITWTPNMELACINNSYVVKISMIDNREGEAQLNLL